MRSGQSPTLKVNSDENYVVTTVSIEPLNIGVEMTAWIRAFKIKPNKQFV